jgi:hypothetical protein
MHLKKMPIKASLHQKSLRVKQSFECGLGLFDDRTQFITLDLSQGHDNGRKHSGCIGYTSIGGFRQEILGGAQNHFNGHCVICEGRSVLISPPPDLDPLKQSKSLRHMVKSFGAPSGIDSRHCKIVHVLGAAVRVEVWESKGYMSSEWGEAAKAAFEAATAQAVFSSLTARHA